MLNYQSLIFPNWRCRPAYQNILTLQTSPSKPSQPIYPPLLGTGSISEWEGNLLISHTLLSCFAGLFRFSLAVLLKPRARSKYQVSQRQWFSIVFDRNYSTSNNEWNAIIIYVNALFAISVCAPRPFFLFCFITHSKNLSLISNPAYQDRIDSCITTLAKATDVDCMKHPISQPSPCTVPLSPSLTNDAITPRKRSLLLNIYLHSSM